MDFLSIFNLPADEFKKELDKMDSDEITRFIHDMKPNQRRIFLDNLSNEDIVKYRNMLPKVPPRPKTASMLFLDFTP